MFNTEPHVFTCVRSIFNEEAPLPAAQLCTLRDSVPITIAFTRGNRQAHSPVLHVPHNRGPHQTPNKPPTRYRHNPRQASPQSPTDGEARHRQPGRTNERASARQLVAVGRLPLFTYRISSTHRTPGLSPAPHSACLV